MHIHTKKYRKKSVNFLNALYIRIQEKGERNMFYHIAL